MSYIFYRYIISEEGKSLGPLLLVQHGQAWPAKLKVQLLSSKTIGLTCQWYYFRN